MVAVGREPGAGRPGTPASRQTWRRMGWVLTAASRFPLAVFDLTMGGVLAAGGRWSAFLNPFFLQSMAGLLCSLNPFPTFFSCV